MIQLTLKWYKHMINNVWIEQAMWTNLESLNDLELILNWLTFEILDVHCYLKLYFIMINWFFTKTWYYKMRSMNSSLLFKFKYIMFFVEC
jgi:hypothetical protein